MVTVVQYPCSQFDYLTSGRTETEVQELFEAWQAVHHPALIDSDAVLPRWEPASYPPFDLQNDIVVIPPCCESFWSEEWEKQTADCLLIRNTVQREEIVQKILAARNIPPSSFDDKFVADCYAVAAARFLFALISRNLYYIQSPDDSRIKGFLTDAIQSVRNEQPESLQQSLQSAFDTIVQAKDNFHPTQNFFIELFLAPKTTLGEPLRQLLNENRSLNLFLSTNDLATLPETHSESFALLKSKTEQGNVRFIVDDTAHLPLSLLPVLDVADSVLAGISIYRDLLNISPAVFGHLESGLSPVLPQLLKLSELRGALHFAPLTGWRIQEDTQSKILWQGTDHTAVDALVRYPIDASKFLGFFELAVQLGSQMGNDHAPTSVLALFPGQQSPWLESLRRMTRFTSGLGKFVNIDEYFNETAHIGGMNRFGYEAYPISPLTSDKDAVNPISQWNELYRNSMNRQVRSLLETCLSLLGKPIHETSLPQQFIEAVLPSQQAASFPESENTNDDLPPSIVVNPLSFPRKVFVSGTTVDVPPLGYAFVHSSPQKTPPVAKKTLLEHFLGTKQEPVLSRKMDEEMRRGEKRQIYLLENKYFSAKFDAQSGMLRSIFTNRSRFNQLSQQIAFYKNQIYSIQTADEVVITQSSTEIGQIQITGRLVLPEGDVVARYIQKATIRRQSRLLEFDLTLDPLFEFDADRWNSYIAVRYAWNDDTLEMRGGLNDSVHTLPDRKYVHSPRFVDLRHEVSSLTLLTEGLPFHRRSGDRQLDTLLVVQGETQRHFRLGIGVNMPNPVFVSQEFLLPQDEFIIPISHRPKNSSVWLFQIESQNVIALHWEPVQESERIIGFMVYLQETEGRRAHFKLRSFLLPKSAAAMNFQGKQLKTIKVDGDAVLIDMHPHELLPLLVRTVDESL